MAEPVRKCSRCRLRVQGVRPHEDGHSYCPRCLAQIELTMQAAAVAEPEREEPLEDRDDESPEEQPVTTLGPGETAEDVDADIEEERDDLPLRLSKRLAPEPEAAPAPTPVVPTPAVQAAAEAFVVQEVPGRERGAITGWDENSSLTLALRKEREGLLQHRRTLVDELHRIEQDIHSIGIRVAHVDALLDPDVEAGPSAQAV